MTSSPVDADAQLQRAAMLCELRRFEEAISLLSSTLASNPDAAEVWAQLTIAQLGNGQPDAALQAAIRAATLAPDGSLPQRLLSASLLGLGRIDEAVLAARRAVAAAPDDWSCQLQLGIALLSARKVGQARAVANRALAMAPHEPMSHLLLGDIARARHRYAQAENHVRQALAIDPTSASTLSHLALVELRRFGHLNTTRLARSASRVADALRADARNTRIRDRLDKVLGEFLYVESALVWLVSLVLRALGSDGSAAARAVPAVLLAVPVIVAARTVRTLPPAVRGRLSRVLRQRRVAAAVALEALAVAASLFAAAAPAGMRQGAVGIAAGSAAWAALLILYNRYVIHSRIGRQPARMLGNGVLRLAAAACWLLALTCIAFAENRAAGGVAAVAFAAGGLAIRRNRRQRA